MMKKLIYVLIFGVAIYTLLAFAPVEEPNLVQGKQMDGVVRFHVVANSNSTADQELKLMVRDAVLDYLHPKLEQVQDEGAAAQVIQHNLNQVEEVAADVLRSQGCGDQVKAYYGVFDFPAKAYGQTTFPKGKYQALRIILGEGNGENWWCCLFPPLCYVDLTSTAQQFIDGEETVFGGQSDEIDEIDENDATEEIGEKEYYLTTKIGEWLEDSKDHSILSWIWSRHS